MVKFRPLGSSEKRAFQCLVTLDVNNVNILVDTGWDELMSQDTLSELIDLIPSIDLILLTHATVGHTGAFCYLRNKYPEFRAIPAYATLPVCRMSMMMTLELYRYAGLCGPFNNDEAMSQSDVEKIWSEVNTIKYSQPLKLHTNPRLEGTVITAYNAGHSLGGSLWKIYNGVDSVIVALDWNHARDAHLNGAFLEPKTGTILGDLHKPSLLITSTSTSSGQPLTKARQNFLGNIERALKRGGTVLIPTSSGSRVLELILILEKYMSTQHRGTPLIYFNSYGKQALNQASSMLEWMVPSIIADWQVQNQSPFDTSNVQFVGDLTTFQQKWSNGPKVVLASGECLESGPSKELFLKYVAEDSNSCVILNEICPPETLGSNLLRLAGSSEYTQLNEKLESVTWNTLAQLTGKSLEAYNKKRESDLEHAVITAAQERKNQQLIDTSAQADEESSDSDAELEEADVSHHFAGTILGADDNYDYECEKSSDAETAMFPFHPKRRRVDEYGEFMPAGLFADRSKNSSSKRAEAFKKSSGNDAVTPPESPREDKQATKLVADSSYNQNEKPLTLVPSTRNNLRVICAVAYSDMNGITNARSLLMVVRQVQPARLIALPGSPGSEGLCEQLEKQCPIFKVGDKPIEFPRSNFSVDVRLDSSLKLEWHNLVGGYSVSRISGTLEFDPHDRIRKSGAVLVSSANKESKDQDYTQLSKPITIGDLRLTSLRKMLTDAGMKAEFLSQGVLVCNDKVVVRKSGDRKYTLEGGIDEDYYKVREAMRQFVTTL